ncbi:hypothetical protein GEMRC1_008374 [Eukaryota sp. GEM-RC1]
MIISRSTDFEQLFFKYCFKRPFIQSVTPNPFPLTGSLILTGSDFSTNFEFFSVVSNFPPTIVSNYTHDEIILDVPYICNITSTTFEILLIIGNQTSNSFELVFGPPIVSYQPVPLSPSGETILLEGPYFAKIFNCFSNSNLQFSVVNVSFVTSNYNEIVVTTGEFYGLTELVILVEYLHDLKILMSIPVTSFVANNTAFVCFVGIPCEIEVYSYLPDFTFVDTFLPPVDPKIIHILNFQYTVYSAAISIVSFVSGVPNDLQICGRFGCFSIFNLPFVIKPSAITPKYFQWLNEFITTEVVVEVEGISFYSYSVIQNSFYFGNCQSLLLDLHDSFLVFEIEITGLGTCTLIGSSFLDTVFFGLSIEIRNFLIFPPKVSFYS